MQQSSQNTLLEADPTQMCRLDFPVGTVVAYTGKNVEEVFGESHDGTKEEKKNKVYHDPDGVWQLVEIWAEDAKMQRFLSYFYRGILPVADVIEHREYDGESMRMKYYSLAFDPEKIEGSYTEAECLAGSHLLEVFGDEDHYYMPEDGDHKNMVKQWEKHYFYDFQVNPHPLKKFPQKIIPYGGYGFVRKDVREVFYRMVRELYTRYDGNEGIKHFFAIGEKAWLSLQKTQDIWIKFMTQLEHLSRLDESVLEVWAKENEQYMVE